MQDGHITTEDLIAFFGETGTEKEGESNARYWLEQIDGYGDNTGYITQVTAVLALACMHS